MFDLQPINGIVIMSSWNTDGGVSRHAMPVVGYFRSQGYRVKVFTHYKESSHGVPLNVEDENFVIRCYTTEGKRIPGFNPFDSELLLNTIEREEYNVFFAEDLGMLPMGELLEIFPRIKRKAKTILMNHDNKPKPDSSIFWKFDWDAVINFLSQQNDFMVKHYPAEKVYLTNFPCYPVFDMDRAKACKDLNLPIDKKIILTFGEYDYIAPFNALRKLREEDPSVYLVALVYTEDIKNALEDKLKKHGFDKGYDRIRIENSSHWKRRAKYVAASQIVVLDKGKGVMGEGSILSSTAFQTIGWGIPILARDNSFFKLFDNAVLRYNDDEGLIKQSKLLLTNHREREKILSRARAFAYAHSPERVSTQILHIFKRCLNPIQYPFCGRLVRFRNNPILRARPDVSININGKKIHWEKLVYNAAAVRLKKTTYLLYRALGEDGISRVGLWWSKDGYHEDGRLPFPIFGPRKSDELPNNPEKRREEQMKRYGMVREIGGTEDPRVTLIGSTLYMTYTAYGDIAQLAMTKIEVEDFLKGIQGCSSYEQWNALWVRNGRVFNSLDDKDAILFPTYEYKNKITSSEKPISQRKDFVNLFPELVEGKFALIHRVFPDMQILHAEDLRNLGPGVGKTFLMPMPGMWDHEKIGAGAPPLKTKYGWLHIYHGVGREDGRKMYRLGVILASLNDPANIIYRSPHPILEAEENYEVNGWVSNVVFTCGAVPKKKDSHEVLDENDEIIVYYGAADETIGAAEGRVAELIPEAIRCGDGHFHPS